MQPKKFLLLIAFLNCTVIYAQQRLSQSRHSSPYTYVYALSDDEIITLYKKGFDHAEEKLLHTLKDSFPTGAEIPARLPSGNYVQVYAHENTLNIEPLIRSNVICKLVNNNKDLVVVLHTIQGELIKDATVQTGKHTLNYDEATQVWRLNNYDKKGFLQIRYKGVLTCVEMEHRIFPGFFKRTWYKIKRAFQFRRKVRYILDHRDDDRDNGRISTTKGFITFSKPMYKPLDTVRIKAFIVDKKGVPVDSKLLLRIKDDYNDPDADTILTTLSPYRPGAYEYQFVLSDSLNLRLDKDYYISLETTTSKGKEAEDRDVLIQGKISLEEYELHSITFSARTDKKEHTRNEPVALYVKAKDENDLAVMDGKVAVVIKTGKIRDYHASKLFIPDTLWQYSQQMDALGETKIPIPDSIFPLASLDYTIECEFLNSNNESRNATIKQTYQYNTKAFTFKLINDSLHLTYANAGKQAPQSAWLYALNSKQDTVQATKLLLPAAVKVNQYAAEYELENDSLYDDYELKNEMPDIQNISSRTSDSIHIQISNPRNLNFWYTIFAGNKVLLRGYGNNLSWNAATITNKYYFVAIQYIWADKVSKENFTIPYMDKNLNIDVIAPADVYPGQLVNIGIAVTDNSQKPVPDADITAYAFTSKFDHPHIPDIPYLGKYYYGRKSINDYSPARKDYTDEQKVKLNWEKWRAEMGLDSIRYFQFRHPDPLFRYYEPAKDSVTQVAPFVMGKGNFIPVHVIYINELPIYFSQADQVQPYSFSIPPGWNTIVLRTPYQKITFDSIFIKKGMKNFISIDTAAIDKNITFTHKSYTLTSAEVANLENYMIKVENTFMQPAYITQNDRVYWLNPESTNRYSYQNNAILTGPLTGADATLIVKDNFTQRFSPEAANSFNIHQGLIKQKFIYHNKLFSEFLLSRQTEENLTGEPLTEKDIDSILTEKQETYLRTNNLSSHSNNSYYGGQLDIRLQNDTLSWRKDVLQFFLFRYDDPQYIKTLSGNTGDFGKMETGNYKLLVLLTRNRYFITDSIQVKNNGTNFYNISSFPIQQNSKMITDLMEGIKSVRYNNARIDNPTENIAETFNKTQMSRASLTRSVNGVVVDEKGVPLPGVIISLKGTSFGTVSNSKGEFHLNVTPKGILHAALLGYYYREVPITEDESYKITMVVTNSSLNEVIVIGYGTTTKRYMSSSISVVQASGLSGRVAGIQIRGQNSLSINNQPLIIVDGLPFSGKMEDIKPETIKSVNVLKDADAIAIYGSRGSNGVILITTSNAVANNNPADPDNPDNAAGNTLRRNFHDDAFWQPRLRTDANGKTSFNVTFPDDITNWRTFVIAMTAHKQSGIAETKIRSFKALSANLALPNFAVEGDSINVIGKMLSYMPDSITVNRTFTVNDSIYKTGSRSFKNAAIDTMPVYIHLADSIAFKYTTLKDGNFDGEERKIPVIEQGTTETAGFFAALYKDTAFTYTPSHPEPVNIYASSAILPVLEDEIQHVKRYEYLCNEQTASKLKAFLLDKKINPAFKGERDITDLIERLKNGRKDALWGWWENSPVSMWVSRQVIEALLMAEEMGYPTNLNKQIPIDYLVHQLNSGKETDSIGCMLLLSKLNAKIDYKSYIDSFKVHTKVDAYENLRISILQQREGLPVNLQRVLAGEQHTLFGNPYWGENTYRLSDNSIQHTLMVYQILRKQGGYEDLLQKIRGYFLEQRKDGHWRNTYESSLILETILPDVMAEQKAGTPALTINGKTISTFPYAATLNAPVSISKKGALPVYFTAYQQYHNRQPQKLSKPFTVTSSFNKEKLKAGQPVILTVDVDVNESGDYVMVEIPIPAGCSYNDKPQSWYNNEVHREYFKHKVSIFCSSLTKGKHTFTVSLLPRYTGSYYLNPAKVELQYFPVFMGREGLKKVDIR